MNSNFNGREHAKCSTPFYWASADSPMPSDATGIPTTGISDLSSEDVRFRSANASTATLASAYKLSSKASSSLSAKQQSGPSSFLQCSTVTRLAPFGSPSEDLSALNGTVGFTPSPDEAMSAVHLTGPGNFCFPMECRIRVFSGNRTGTLRRLIVPRLWV